MTYVSMRVCVRERESVFVLVRESACMCVCATTNLTCLMEVMVILLMNRPSIALHRQVSPADFNCKHVLTTFNTRDVTATT